MCQLCKCVKCMFLFSEYKMDDQWQGQMSFEGIDWNDISDAEFSGDQAAIEKLM